MCGPQNEKERADLVGDQPSLNSIRKPVVTGLSCRCARARAAEASHKEFRMVAPFFRYDFYWNPPRFLVILQN